jgi:aminoglycoside phosphotransferase (APT) family kinase protein
MDPRVSTGADGRMAPEEAALAVAADLGLGADRAQVAGAGTHVLVRLEPGPVAARVTGDGPLARFAGDLDAEVRIAAALHAAGAPVVPPLDGVPPRAHARGGRRVTLWRWWDRAPADDSDTPEAAGRALAACHRALARVAPLPALEPWGGLRAARALLGEVPPAAREVLAPHLAVPGGPVRPVHGDAHAGNVLPGPVWHDWEDAQLACAEWDLACLVAPGRVVGMDFGHGEAALAGYDEPYDAALLERCVAARTAQQAVAGLLLGDEPPGLPERVAVRMAWLAEPAKR